jgi:RalA-binding protein 1
MPPSQFTNRPPPRTSSIDSAISTVSRHSADGNNASGSGSSSSAPTHADIQTLIETAGSAEALIGYMLKEKASAATQNAQLWKLVDKQRAMILGLNKDLEQALKDKDRYRKKLKEQLGVVPPVPSSSAAIMAARAAAAAESAEEHEDSPVESFSLVRSESMPLPERGGVFGGGLEISYPEAMETLEEGPSSPTATRNGALTPESVRTPLGSQHSDSTSLKEGSGFAPLSPRAQEMYVPKDESGNADNAPFQYPVSSAKIASRAHHLMKLGISTNVAPASGLGKSPIRKAPPAPLALASPLSETRAQLHTDDEEDDEYEDDNVSIDEIPGYQQRAETEGEVIVTQDHNDESVSIERMPVYDRRTSWTHTPIDKKGPPSLALLPSVNIPHAAPTPRFQDRQAMSLAPPMVHNGKPFSPGLAADGSGIRQQFARAPLPSPGLPSSPRPIDRPMNSPKPKQRPQSPGSPRTSPLSPRLGVAPVPFQPSTPRGLMPQSLNAPLRSPLPRGHEKSDSTTSQGSLEDQVINLIIQPSAINSVDCRVVSSRMRPSRASMLPGSKPRVSENDSVFTLGVFARGTGGEILRVEKDVGALPALDAVLRKFITFNAKLPDRALFTGHAPARIDSRRAAVDEYFAGVLGATMDERAALALCQFFSTDVVDHIPSADVAGSFKDGSSIASGVQGKPQKEGYLTKRGKNFGGWKARYFVLNGPVLKYYEAPGGAHLGQIKLQSAQIGRQSQSQKVKEPLEGETDTESQYRHAFLILEPKRKDSSTLVRHVLCAESDAERDEWVEALMQYVDKPDPSEDASSKEGREKKKRYGPKHKDSKDSQTIEQDKLHALGYEQTTPGPEPARGPTPEELQRMRNTPSPQNSISSIIATQSSSTITAPTLQPAPERTAQVKQISAPTNGSVISDLAAWGAKLTHSEQKAAKKRSIWGFRQRSSSDLDNHHLGGTPYHQIGERLNRSVFGATLEEAVHLSKPFGVTVSLPAVVYRCIEYLEAKDAASEEGIFRLSGSNVVIKGLRERFNTGKWPPTPRVCR